MEKIICSWCRCGKSLQKAVFFTPLQPAEKSAENRKCLAGLKHSIFHKKVNLHNKFNLLVWISASKKA